MAKKSKLKVTMTCQYCEDKAIPSIVSVSTETGRYPEEFPYGHNIPLACRSCHKLPEIDIPELRDKYMESILALLKQVSARKDATEALATAKQLAAEVKSPFRISLE